ncbi:MAG: hypothetical protein IJF25_01775 [Oscillospiraceae bacterium]|nr:hypothetical protein [Oscillospiraceae bacterium]MBQ4539220.1 hypothetical protein [Oscillospiraceae bacterium]
MKNLDENAKKHLGIKKLLALIAVITAIAAIICFAAPTLRKSNSISATGENVLSSMRPAALAVSYYSSQDIAALSEKPVIDANYKNIAGLLAQFSDLQGYESVYIISRGADKNYKYIIDGRYRDNGKSGTDYFAPAADYPADNGYKAVKSAADKIYSGKSTGDFASSLVTRADLKQLVAVCLPIYGVAHSVSAILCIEADPGNTAYHMVGSVNLYYAALILLGICAVCVILLFVGKKVGQFRDNRRTAKAEKEAAASVSSEPMLEADDPIFTDNSDSSVVPPAAGEDNVLTEHSEEVNNETPF